MIEVQSEIPVPPRKCGPKPKYPWADMDVGDSFFALATVDSLTSCAHNALGKGCYTLRQSTEGGVHGVRVWRLK